MADDNSQLDTDGYYGDDDADSEEIDLSFLNESEGSDTSDGDAAQDDNKKGQ